MFQQKRTTFSETTWQASPYTFQKLTVKLKFGIHEHKWQDMPGLDRKLSVVWASMTAGGVKRNGEVTVGCHWQDTAIHFWKHNRDECDAAQLYWMDGKKCPFINSENLQGIKMSPFIQAADRDESDFRQNQLPVKHLYPTRNCTQW